MYVKKLVVVTFFICVGEKMYRWEFFFKNNKICCTIIRYSRVRPRGKDLCGCLSGEFSARQAQDRISAKTF